MFDLKNVQSKSEAKKAESKQRPVAPSDRKTRLMEQTQRKRLVLPVSQTAIMLSSQQFDPEELNVSALNKRLQNLLSPKDPNIIKLKDRIEKEGQLDPVLVRFVAGEPELIYGSRRRFVLSLINEERKARGEEIILLEAWSYSNIPDVDAKRLADSENDDKEPISPYEEAVYLKHLRDELNMETSAISLSENISSKTVTDRLRIADIDLEFVNMLPSPACITQQAGASFSTLVNRATTKKRTGFIEEFKDFKFETLKELVAEFKAATQSKPKKVKAVEFKVGKKVKAKMTPNRDDKTKFKIDVFDMTEEQQEEMAQLLIKWSK